MYFIHLILNKDFISNKFFNGNQNNIHTHGHAYTHIQKKCNHLNEIIRSKLMNAKFQFAEKHLSGASTSMLNIKSTEMNDMRKTFATKVMLFKGEFPKDIMFNNVLKWLNFLFSEHLIDSCPKCGCEVADENKVDN